MTDQPSVGRVVHYTSYGTPNGEYSSVCRAAVITSAEAGVVDLCVLNPEGVFFNRGVALAMGDDRTGGTWHWPERV